MNKTFQKKNGGICFPGKRPYRNFFSLSQCLIGKPSSYSKFITWKQIGIFLGFVLKSGFGFLIPQDKRQNERISWMMLSLGEKKIYIPSNSTYLSKLRCQTIFGFPEHVRSDLCSKPHFSFISFSISLNNICWVFLLKGSVKKCS